MTPEEAFREILAATRLLETTNTTPFITSIRRSAQAGLKAIPPKSKDLVVLVRDPKAGDDEFPWSAKIRDTSLVGYGETVEEALDALLDEIKVAETFRAKVLHWAKGEGI